MNLLEWITGGGVSLVALLTLVQITPIKINPWSHLARAAGKAINGEVIEKVDKLETDVKSVKNDVQSVRDELSEQMAVTYRARILRFGDEVLHGTKHTKEHFDQILRDIRDYERYCGNHPDFENGVTEATSQRIKDIYSRQLQQNDFL